MQSGTLFLPERLHFLIRARWSGLRARMTISYMLVTLGSLLTFLILGALVASVLSALSFDPLGNRTFLLALQQQAQAYALSAAVQAQGVALDPQTNFIPGQAHTLAFSNQENPYYGVFAPYVATASQDPFSIHLALLVAPDGHLVASSYPSRYAAGMPISALLPAQMQAINLALAGKSSVGTESVPAATVAYDAETVWSKEHWPIGAIFLQVPVPGRDGIFSQLGNLSLGNIFLLLLITPVGMFFGWIATRGLVQRVQRLVVATAQFAAGDYTQRILVSHRDEIGHLEEQFNTMAEQLVEQIAQRQQLAEQNARLAERSRISRELHDAISQDLFSVGMLAAGLQRAVPADSPFQHQIRTLELTTNIMIREMRALLLELRPTTLEHLSLAKALEELAEAYRTRLGISIQLDLNGPQLPARIEHAILRIAQEALSNAARHSHASEITLTLAPCSEGIELIIQDNGQGFDSEDPSLRHGLGLRLLQERVEELHGSGRVESRPGMGTTLKVHIPLEEQV